MSADSPSPFPPSARSVVRPGPDGGRRTWTSRPRRWRLVLAAVTAALTVAVVVPATAYSRPGGGDSAASSTGAPADAPILYVSDREDRSAAMPLDGARLTGDSDLYVFVVAAGARDVTLSLDAHKPRREKYAPYDLLGSDGRWGAPRPLPAGSLAPGPHIVRAVVTLPSGRSVDTTAEFMVGTEDASAPGTTTGADTTAPPSPSPSSSDVASDTSAVPPPAPPATPPASTTSGATSPPPADGIRVSTAAELIEAVATSGAGATILLDPGEYRISAPLQPLRDQTIAGAGAGRTIVLNTASWAPGPDGLPSDSGTTESAVDCSRYLVDLGRRVTGVTLRDVTLSGPELHGGICGFSADGLSVTGVEFRDFLWSGVRAYRLRDATFLGNTFIDAGGQSKVTSGSSGGGLYLTYVYDTEIAHNRFSRTAEHPGHYYGVKGRQARDVRIHHNTIDVNFAIEFPFENDRDVEISHNYLGGTVSIPKFGGGTPNPDGWTFDVHHNYFTNSYAFEFHRNDIHIHHNLFDFSLQRDGGNLISGFSTSPAAGGAVIQNNLIRNPGRGLFWNEGVYNDVLFANNHVRGTSTATPRTEGLFAFRPSRAGAVTDWGTIRIQDNNFELSGVRRPLMRLSEGRQAVIENNALQGISDADQYANPRRDRPQGPTRPLSFPVGAEGEFSVDGWTLRRP